MLLTGNTNVNMVRKQRDVTMSKVFSTADCQSMEVLDFDKRGMSQEHNDIKNFLQE